MLIINTGRLAFSKPEAVHGRLGFEPQCKWSVHHYNSANPQNMSWLFTSATVRSPIFFSLTKAQPFLLSKLTKLSSKAPLQWWQTLTVRMGCPGSSGYHGSSGFGSWPLAHLIASVHDVTACTEKGKQQRPGCLEKAFPFQARPLWLTHVFYENHHAKKVLHV